MALRLTLLTVLLAWLVLAAPCYAQEAEETVASSTEQAAPAVSLKPVELPPADETRALLTEILAQPEFVRDAETEKKSNDLLQALNDWLNNLFGNVHIGGYDWVGVALVALLVLAVGYLLVQAYLAFTRNRKKKQGDDEQLEANLSFDELAARAADSAARGDFREAVRLVFNAAVKSLDMPFSTLQTNYQVLAYARVNCKGAVVPLRQLTAIFEDAWYGTASCDSASYEQARSLYMNVSSAVSRSAQ